MKNTSAKELNIEDLGMVSGGELSAFSKYITAMYLHMYKCGDLSEEDFHEMFHSEELLAYIDLIWDDIPSDPYTPYSSPNIPTGADVNRETSERMRAGTF